MTNGRGWREPKMVRWYHPTQLLRTGAEVLIAGILGARSDRRLLYGFANLDPGKKPLPEPSPTGEAVVDYIADTGDGWNPSYAVAYWASRSLAETSLPVEARTPAPAEPCCGRDRLARRHRP